MITNRLVVYNASAGSGKTFQIATTYLNRLIQSQDDYVISKLIGITFTNKATEEMKKRIIDNLINAAKGDISDVMEAVSEQSKSIIKRQTGIDNDSDYTKEIIKRSRQRLTEILHYYDEFQLTTIDKLMFKIIKTFAKDMHLSADVEVVMDYKEVVNKLIDKLINAAENDSLLSKFLIDFALKNVDEEKYWDIKRDLADISQIIFDDNHFKEINSLQNKSLNDFYELQKFLNAEIAKIERQFEKLGRSMGETYAGFGAKYVNRSLPPLVRDLQFKKNKIKIADSLRKKIDSSNYVYYNKTQAKNLTPDEYKMLTGPVNEHIHQFLGQIVSYVDQNLETYKFYKALRQEVNALSINNELQKEIEDFKTINNSIFINDFNKLILEQILKDLATDTPYIYMRLGEKFAHYFVDEFQDTSYLQWANLVPLMREALSKEFTDGTKGEAMIVGDAKQSIYRFRGGKPEQFITLSNPDINEGEGNPFAPLVNKTVKQLEYNWRSQGNIIKFNNDFFRIFSNYLRPPYDFVYQNVTQKLPKHKKIDEGYINIRFLDRANRKEGLEKAPFEEAVLLTIQQAEKNGFSRDEICILVDKNNAGSQIADFLNQNNVDVISSETLKVANAQKVKFLISWLYFLHSGNPVHLYDVVRYLSEKDGVENAVLYEQLLTGKDMDKTSRIQLFKSIGYDLDEAFMSGLPVYEILIYLIQKFGLNSDKKEQAYMQAFLEKVFDFEIKNNNGIQEFLNEWEEIADKFSIDVPEVKGAVKIMTVHKSKGLEFPVVIYYTDKKLISSQDLKNKVWVELNPEKFKGFGRLPVSLGTLKESQNKIYQAQYEQAVSEKTFDSLNRLYVAMTRASEQLYLILYKLPKDQPEYPGINQIVYNYLQNNYADFNGEEFEYGNPERAGSPKQKTDNTDSFEKLIYHNWQLQEDYIKINTSHYELWSADKKNAIAYGMQIHGILEKITTARHWQVYKDKYLQGIADENKQKVAELVAQIINHPQLQTYFGNDYEILNERSILLPDKQNFVQKRPDRLMFKDGKISILDYKTGAKSSKHQQQLKNYAQVLNEAGFETDKLILVYIDDSVSVEIL